MRRNGLSQALWNLSFGKRIEEELYNIVTDPECINNLAADTGLNSLKQKLREQLEKELRSSLIQGY